jgi:hypothetical protein
MAESFNQFFPGKNPASTDDVLSQTADRIHEAPLKRIIFALYYVATSIGQWSIAHED